MNLNDKFDKTIKQKISEAEFPFDEANWEKASSMIDAERGASIGAKSSKLFLLVGTLFLGVAAGTFAFLYLGHDIENNKIIVKNEIAQVKNSDREEFSNKSDAQQMENSQNETKIQSQAEVLNDKITSGNNNSVTKSVKEEVNVPVQITETAKENVSESKNENEKENVANEAIEKPSSNKQATPSQSRSNTNSVQKRSSVKKQAPVLGNAKAEKRNSSLNSNVVDMELLNAASSTESEITTYDYLEMHSSVLQMWQKEEVLKNSPHDFIRIYNEDYYKPRRRLHFLNAEAGAAYLLGWQTTNGNDAEGFDYYAGLNYGIYIKKKMSVTLGVQVYNISHINTAFYSRQNFQYDFGYNGNFTNITANELTYVGVPVKFYRNISRTGKLGIGVNTAFLVDSKNTVETYTERDLVKSNIQSVKQKGNFEGVNTMNIMLSANYSHRLGRRLFVNAEFVYGLSDTYKKSATLNATRENNMGIRLGLQYTLFER